MIGELLRCHRGAEKISRTLVQMFNDCLSKECEHYNKESTVPEEVLFMNWRCKHPRGNGHCCIALCPKGNNM